MNQSECLVCDRVDSALFYKELRELEFDEKEARMTLKLLSDIYFKDVTFFAGMKKGVIKGSITYIISTILGLSGHDKKTHTQYILAEKFNVSENSIRINLNKIRKRHEDLINKVIDNLVSDLHRELK